MEKFHLQITFHKKGNKCKEYYGKHFRKKWKTFKWKLSWKHWKIPEEEDIDNEGDYLEEESALHFYIFL